MIRHMLAWGLTRMYAWGWDWGQLVDLPVESSMKQRPVLNLGLHRGLSEGGGGSQSKRRNIGQWLWPSAPGAICLKKAPARIKVKERLNFQGEKGGTKSIPLPHPSCNISSACVVPLTPQRQAWQWMCFWWVCLDWCDTMGFWESKVCVQILFSVEIQAEQIQ